MRIKAFCALRPAEGLTAKVASPPYDVLSTEEARTMAENDPMSFLHITRPEIDLDHAVAGDSEEAYNQAAVNFKHFQEKAYLVQDEQPGLFLYRLTMGNHEQRGLVACSHTGDYDAGLIKKHENTRPGPENDRTRHIQTLEAQTGPVFLTYRDEPAIDQVLASVEQTPALFDFTAPDGIKHAVWRIPEPDRIVAIFKDIPATYIADGHHRAAASARVARERRAATGGNTDAESDWFLTVLFPAGQLKILPYNRVVHDLNGMTPEALLEALDGMFTLTKDADPSPQKSGCISMYLAGRWYGLQWTPEVSDDPVAVMDVSVLQHRVLDGLLGIKDPRKDPRVSFVGGIRGTAELEKLVNAGDAAAAFSMYPTTVDQLLAVADANQCMPPKSTWFEPKLRSGLFVHLL
ncbi:MAG: DUF1015 domain-containing protein [Spartobacteria bacterium]|nr:DUF1015 domain-containing protein [Spartobacteria bacterium]